MQEFARAISAKLNIRLQQTEAVLQLLAEQATIPFIARYRKDVTGNLDEVQIQAIQEEAKFQKEFSERKAFIEKTITEQGKMTEAMQALLNKAATLNELEDIYLPYKPKRKTKAQTARENGLEPLALLLLKQQAMDIMKEVAAFINDKITNEEEALQGARDIIAEMVNEDAIVRARLRKLFEQEALVSSKVLADKETEAIKYKDYFSFSEPVSRIPGHRALAILRGFMEGFLRMGIEPEEEKALAIMEDIYLSGMSECSPHIKKAIKDAYRRLLQPSLESEFRMAMKQKADEDAINVFSENLKQLLLSAPLGSKRVLAIDPGYRTGCKTVVLNEQGALLFNTVIYIHEGNKADEAGHIVKGLVNQYAIEAIAIGDGTAGRETEQLVKRQNFGLPVFLVNEDGASVYSASEAAREEFPDQDITVRGAVSIGRRLMDPLAELVKIDPKSIGVGQYQHDVSQPRLKEKLDQTVINCVNLVGVNLNTASKHLLTYVSGVGETLAKNIVEYRESIGKFTNREQLKEVPRLGNKAFEQCAGFLRVTGGTNPLDASAVHPETYTVAATIAKDLNVSLQQMIGNEPLLKTLDIKNYASFGALTVSDIIKELKKPGIDPRSTAQQFDFAAIYKIEDVTIGMIVPGIVTNITRFGAFIDIGVKQDGLVHISEIANKFITDPAQVLKLNQQVMVKVTEVDIARKRIALSIKQAEELPAAKPQNKQASSKPKPEPVNMNDALSALKNKFGGR